MCTSACVIELVSVYLYVYVVVCCMFMSMSMSVSVCVCVDVCVDVAVAVAVAADVYVHVHVYMGMYMCTCSFGGVPFVGGRSQGFGTTGSTQRRVSGLGHNFHQKRKSTGTGTERHISDLCDDLFQDPRHWHKHINDLFEHAP